MNNSINEISFKSKECKKENHFLCNHRWKGLGFKVYCNCECHRKLVLGKDVRYNNSSNEKIEKNSTITVNPINDLTRYY